jgi:hypothetical protein
VECSATDANGNTGSASFNLTVEDTTPPTVASHDDVTVEATGPGWRDRDVHQSVGEATSSMAR